MIVFVRVTAFLPAETTTTVVVVVFDALLLTAVKGWCSCIVCLRRTVGVCGFVFIVCGATADAGDTAVLIFTSCAHYFHHHAILFLILVHCPFLTGDRLGKVVIQKNYRPIAAGAARSALR